MAEDEIKKDVNEFEQLDGEDSPPSAVSDIPAGDDMVAKGAAGAEYDFDKASEVTKSPPRVDIEGQEVVIEDAKIILPPSDRAWDVSRDGKTQYKMCTFRLFYDKDNQQEFYSGVRVFKRMEGTVEKYSHPNIMANAKNQASKLLQAYAKFKGKEAREVSMKEFLSYLKSKPKARIKAETVKNPTNDEEVKKNLVGEFI